MFGLDLSSFPAVAQACILSCLPLRDVETDLPLSWNWPSSRLPKSRTLVGRREAAFPQLCILEHRLSWLTAQYVTFEEFASPNMFVRLQREGHGEEILSITLLDEDR